MTREEFLTNWKNALLAAERARCKAAVGALQGGRGGVNND